MASPNNGSTGKVSSGTAPSAKSTARDDSSTQEREVVSQEQTEEQEESKRQEDALNYASQVAKTNREKNDNTLIDSDEDMAKAQWLIANGYAEMHATQEGMDTYNYILLTQDGLRALSSYNEEKTT